MSSGKCWRSESSESRISPRAASNPACNAGGLAVVAPQLEDAQALLLPRQLPETSQEASRLPSSTRMISKSYFPLRPSDDGAEPRHELAG